MTGTYFIRCPRCGRRWSVSSQRNAANAYVCPDCVELQARRMNKHRNFQTVAVTAYGTYGGAYAAN